MKVNPTRGFAQAYSREAPSVARAGVPEGAHTMFSCGKVAARTRTAGGATTIAEHRAAPIPRVTPISWHRKRNQEFGLGLQRLEGDSELVSNFVVVGGTASSSLGREGRMLRVPYQ